MTASCGKDFKGLTSGHAYTLLGNQELYSNNNNNREIKEQLIKLRNPDGAERQFIGQWNQKDPNWNKFAGQINLQEKGVFYLSVSDFKLAFFNYDIAFL